jgi:hypothetical protein
VFVADKELSAMSSSETDRSVQSQPESAARETQVRRIGILQCMGGFDDAALRYLILYANRYQSAFQFEFVPFEESDPFIAPLLTSDLVDRNAVVAGMVPFFLRYRSYLERQAQGYGKLEVPPYHFQIISEISFHDNYYYISNSNVAVIAMGQWRRSLAPPSILEFIQALALEDAILGVCPELLTHLGTRGCLFDFTGKLSDARQKVLASSICQSCQSEMATHGHSVLVDELRPLLARGWLGSPTDPASPAGVAAKLGHDLFLTKGLKPNIVESVKMNLVQEGTKQILKVIAAVVIAALLLFLGLAAAASNTASTPGKPAPAPSSATSKARP